VSEEAMCVIVTSGTLSPIGSLEGELGVSFPIKVEAPHVVPRRQIHVEALDALGDFTAKAQDNPKMPANLASLLLKYLKVVPKGTGALVFLPKYALIRRIMEDWEYSGVLSQLKALVGTVVAEEPGAQTFAGTLDEFRGAVEAPDNKGALMLAVYRGKVSEGLDFKDDFARAVFCVGIPFPSVGDVKVRLKREYNSSRYARECGLMPGGDWYSHQAFRAYNQALGRCIRHQHDYAAIFMVDARFGMSEEADRNKAMVSKWMRNLVQRFRDGRESVGTLAEFFERLTKNPPGPPPVTCTKETTPDVKTSLTTAVDARSVDVKERTPVSTQDEVLGAVDVTFTQAERLRAEEAVREGRHVDLTMSDEDGDEDEEGGDGVADVLAASAVVLPE
jgi:Fanconi anemia group J protein